jgi:hypothetical protein
MAVIAYQWSWETRCAVKAGTACPSDISPSPAPAIDEIESARLALHQARTASVPGGVPERLNRSVLMRTKFARRRTGNLKVEL